MKCPEKTAPAEKKNNFPHPRYMESDGCFLFALKTPYRGIFLRKYVLAPFFFLPNIMQ